MSVTLRRRALHGGTEGAIARLERSLAGAGLACDLTLPGGCSQQLGHQPPAFRLVVHNDRLLRAPLSDYELARAYVEGDVDIEVYGDVTALYRLRDTVPARVSVPQALRFASEFLLPPTWVNSRAIRHHYTLDDQLYLTFLDRRYHLYSHCLFASDAEELEDAAEHKLAAMWNALGLQPGMRLLDIGGGWGGAAVYCSSRGVHVTSLTLTEQSADFIRARLAAAGLPGDVHVEDLLNHRPSRPYDHAVIFGVIEHIPTYRRFCRRIWDLLTPGGRLYLDASATREKYAASPFTRHYTWRGPHSCLAVQDLIAELLFHGFHVLRVRQESRDYELTMRHWAQRLDDSHDVVAERSSERVYRAFRVFLWGGAHAFQTNRLQAYSLLAERSSQPGPRPGNLRRLGHYVLSLR
jgi:cyclopropane-fatty-acyl-phospholipid synthase